MSYRDLVAWQVGMELVEAVYRMTSSFPIEERFGLTAQIRRAAVSVPSNIAEGQGRRSGRAVAQHVLVARGSVMEVETQTIIAQRLGFTSQEVSSQVLSRCGELSRVLYGLSRSAASTPDSRLPTGH
jgi:four helix bundle protein